jgi:hypothetical protein
MAWFGPSNQLIQISTGSTRTQFYNKSQSPIQVYADIGNVQVPGQRYFSLTNTTPANPFGSPSIYMLVNYLSTSALTTGNLAAGPAPVYWTDNTFTTVTGITTESLGINFPAGYMMLNTTDLTTLTAAQVVGAQIFICVAGYVKGAFAPTSGTAGIGNFIEPLAGTFSSQSVVAGTAPGYTLLGRQLTAIASGLCDVLVNGEDII